MRLNDEYADFGIRCDGGTRTLFSGVITNPNDIETIIKLVD